MTLHTQPRPAADSVPSPQRQAVETVKKVKFEGAILSEALKRIVMKIVMPYGRKYAKRGMVRVCDGQA
jgi:hypothetical protein